MTTYTAKFTGREVGAIGKFQQFSVQVAAANMGDARLALHETHEHIRDLVMSENRLSAKLNKRERRAQQLLKHYETCEALGRYLGMEKPDGKKISVALWNLETQCHAAATAYCNGERFHGRIFMVMPIALDFGANGSEAWEHVRTAAGNQMRYIFGTFPASFFLNADARGYALKMENESPAGKALIDAVKLHTDWGGYGILSPEITGD